MANLKSDSFLSERIYQTVRMVLQSGPANRPRAILQAYQTFIHEWILIRIKGLEHVMHPDILALLSLIQYTWPDMFAAVRKNPYYFFYLHILAANKPNSVCNQAELDEINDLGLPAVAQSVWWRNLQYPELNRLFRNIELDNDFTIDDLALHITLDKHVRISLSEDQPWEELVSGDPARIKAMISRMPLGLGYESQLLNHVTDLINEIKQDVRGGEDSSKEVKELIDRAEAVIFALGLGSENPECVDFLTQTLLESQEISLSVRLRITYALAYAAQRGNQNAISSLLSEILFQRKEDLLPFRIRVAHLCRSFVLTRPQISTLLSIVSDQNENSRVHKNIIESWLHASWGPIAFEVAIQEKLNELNIKDVLEICEFFIHPNSDWMDPVLPQLGKHILAIVQQDDPIISEKAFYLLLEVPTSSKRKILLMSWLCELIQRSSKFFSKCWQIIGDLQKDRDIAWQIDIWKQLLLFALENDEILLVKTLVNTQRLEASETLKALHRQAPAHWKGPIEDGLAMLSTR